MPMPKLARERLRLDQIPHFGRASWMRSNLGYGWRGASPQSQSSTAISFLGRVQRGDNPDRISRQIDSKSFEVAKRAITQCRLMRSAKHDAGRLIGFESLLPTLRAEAPAIARFQPGE